MIEPAGLAALVWSIAAQTGWPEHFIAWELPLVRAVQYRHCALRAADVWTVEPRPIVAPEEAAAELFAEWESERVAESGTDTPADDDEHHLGYETL